LERSPRCPKIALEPLARIRAHMEKVYGELSAFTSPNNERVDADILEFQVPGGMLSNFRNQLKEQGMADRLEEVMREMLVVREALGWIPLVTPTSQIVGTQAMLNVKFGRWKMISQPAQDVVLGKYGRTPGQLDRDLQIAVEKHSGQSPVKGRPADHLKPRMDALRNELREKNLPDSDEMAVLYAMFPQEVAKLHSPKPKAAEPAPNPTGATTPGNETAPTPGSRYAIRLDGKRYEVSVEDVRS